MMPPLPVLEERLFSFAVIADTHVNPDENECNSPFPVNARANRRLRHVIGELNAQDINMVVHLGDLVHPVPGSGAPYVQAAKSYFDIVAELNVPLTALPGNHDIGDTPIRGAPAAPVTAESVAVWEREFGVQYQAFSRNGIRFVLLNAQLINSGLPDELEQAHWLEQELKASQGRIFVFMHHPLYICDPNEAPHYDNIDPPGRKWLLSLLQEHNVEALFGGHAHNFWYDRYSSTDFYLAPSTSFVRQDYSEMLRAAPPENSEAGRDDRAKLGYFIVHVYTAGHSVQIVRTFGAEKDKNEQQSPVLALAPTPREASRSLIGFDLRQNWAEISEVQPSGGLDEFDRKSARNDYALMALIEMGVQHVRIPLSDLRDAARRDRLAKLTHLGFMPTLFSFGAPSESDLDVIAESADMLVDWEVTLDWSECDSELSRLHLAFERTRLPILVSRMRTKDDVKADGVYFHVINHGFGSDDGAQLDRLAQARALGVHGAVFRLGLTEPVDETLVAINREVIRRSLIASVHLRCGGDNPAVPQSDHDLVCRRVAEAMNTMKSLSATRVFCDTLVDTDRGYFVRPGAIDRACNPNSLLNVVRGIHAGEPA